MVFLGHPLKSPTLDRPIMFWKYVFHCYYYLWFEDFILIHMISASTYKLVVLSCFNELPSIDSFLSIINHLNLVWKQSWHCDGKRVRDKGENSNLINTIITDRLFSQITASLYSRRLKFFHLNYIRNSRRCPLNLNQNYVLG